MTESKMQLEDWLDDLCVRFIINLPEEDLSSVQRICFHVEEAQWFYEDFIRPLDTSLPAMTLRTFCLKMFAHCPLLSVFSHQSTIQAFQMFMDYKQGVPVRGAILLNEAMDHILLVKGWKKSANWSFPRGKTNKDEGDLDCAIREVWEEIGYDIRASGLIGESEVPFIDLKFQDKEMKMFIFTGVPMDTHFETQTRQEISKIAWWPLADLPGYRKNRPQQPQADTMNPNKFFMVEQFIKRLKKWIAAEQKKKNYRRSTSNQYLSAGLATEDLLTEEDQATDGNVQEPDYASQSVSGIGTLEGATAELNRLLGRVPPTQGLHIEALSEIQSTGSKPAGKGNELLAFLHGTTPQAPSNAPPQTPADLVYTNVPDQKTPHHSHPRPPHFSSMAPPPTLPFHPNSASGANFQTQGSAHYLGHQSHAQYDGVRQPGYQQGLGRPQDVPRPQQFQQSYQTPLIHPQPLPPHVQKAVFTGAPVHSPALQQQRQPHKVSSLSQDAEASSMQNPRFPGLHAPMVVPNNNQSPKLTSHSLALLNVFNGRDDRASDLPLRKFTQDTVQASQPQELHAEPSQPRNELLSNQNGTRQNIPNNINLNQTFSRPPISGEQKSTLLEIFKSPTTASAVPPTTESKKLHWDMVNSSGVASTAAPTAETERHVSVLLGMFKAPRSPAAAPNLPRPMEATALPTTSAPSVVELSAVEPLSEAALASSSNNGKRAVHNDFVEGLPHTNPDVMLPFRATSILARPQQPQTPQLAEQTEHARNASERRVHASARKAAANSSKIPPTIRKKSPQKNAEKPFQPQILKRPQQQSPVAAAAELPMATPSGSTALPILPAQNSSAVNQKQELLSMFKTPSTTSPAVSHARTDVPLTRQASQPGKNEHNLISLLGQVPTTGAPLSRTKSKVGATPASYVPAGSSHSKPTIQPEDKQQHLLSLFGKAPESGASPSRTQSSEGQSVSAFSSVPPNRQAIQPGEQQQRLLSMLGKVPPVPGASLMTAQPKDGTSTAPLAETAMGSSSRSRVGSLASGADQTRRGSVAPDLPEDKSAFLLDLLTKLN